MSSKIVLKVSEKGEILYGNEESQSHLQEWGCQIGGLLPDWIQKHLSAIAQSGHLETFEANKNHQIFSFVAVPAPTTGEVYLHGQDITEKRALEVLKEDFINAVSHELRTPLSIIKTALLNLEDGLAGELAAPQKNIVTITQRQIDRIIRIVEDLLNLSRLELGKVPLHSKKIRMAPLIVEALHPFIGLAKQKNILLEQHCSKTIPAVLADPDLLVQVLNNLIDNALRFAKSKIGVDVSEAKKELLVCVRDDGVGIDPEGREHVFEKYCQLSLASGKESYQGFGLGLAICKEIVHLHQGKIWVESKPGKGTQFYFTLPLP